MPAVQMADWQSRKSVAECNTYMLDNKLACDVIFKIGPAENEQGPTTSILAHKYVLISRSCVFCEQLQRSVDPVTELKLLNKDVDVDVFKQLLQFLYSDKLVLNLDSVVSVLSLAIRYHVQSLIDKCLSTIKKNLSYANVCTFMEKAHSQGNNKLKAECHRMILQDPRAVFAHEDYIKLCPDCLASIVKEDELSVEEEQLFEIVMKYAKKKCEENSFEQTPENTKRVLENVLDYIRFPLMSHEFIRKVVDAPNLIPDDKARKLYKYLLTKQGECPGFITTPRKLLFTIQRFPEIASGWGYKLNNPDAICFTCTHDIIIRGVQVYGSSVGTGDLDVLLILEKGPHWTPLETKHVMIATSKDVNIYNLLFDKPVTIFRNKIYCLFGIFKGIITFYGVKGQEKVVNGQVTFTFSKSDRSINNTCPERGQFPGIIYEHLPES